jgi:hypothetical protein
VVAGQTELPPTEEQERQDKEMMVVTPVIPVAAALEE